ncbi:MAG: primosomal protein N' [Candidatus Kapabacteria bacterium]|nr:primosomal protein N' [Ignavibacteriota bacterium]MCW5883585.1 primosomal protein N' [Candidatus Kapabacteria bacterium]
MSKAVKIAVPVPTDQLYTYTIPDDEVDYIGKRVLVEFGSRVLTGIIVSDENLSVMRELKQVSEILDISPTFTESMLRLTRWISEYYMCSWGETLKAATPPSMSPETTIKIKVLKVPGSYEIIRMRHRSPLRAELLNYLMNQEDPVTISTIERNLNNKNIHSALYALERLGFLEIKRVLKREAAMKKIKCLQVSRHIYNDEARLKFVMEKLESGSPIRSRLFSYVFMKNKDNDYPIVKAALTSTQSNHSHLKFLIDKNYLQTIEIETPKKAYDEKNSLGKGDESFLQMTTEQENNYKIIAESIEKGENHTYLLHGITGSGKTLIYLHLIKKAIEQNKSALVLVPEISLTPQLIDRFSATFGHQIALLHSRMTDAERYESWKKIHTGKVRIALGVRSAVFAPFNNLGIIIVDEEHESSYKQDSPAPRYNARDAAVIRGVFENATVVLGSATPSLESMYNAQTGKYTLLEINSRADGALLPKVTIVDMLNIMKKGQSKSMVSKVLYDKIKENLSNDKGTLILQNRRGFSVNIRCTDCSHVPQCKNCAIKLTYHKSKNQLKCHYCGFQTKAPTKCPECNSSHFEIVGFGTQRVEDDIFNNLKNEGFSANVSRLDMDTASKKGNQRRILQNFASGKIDILVGTQMIAKGLDFKNVSLVGVINSDIQLYLPDFRAAERTFQLLTQVSGRAGRDKAILGEVFIQTFEPDNSAIKYAQNADYKGFYDSEIKIREAANYPPYARFVIIEFYGKEENLVSNYASAFEGLLPKDIDFAEILGPILPAMPKLNNNHRRLIIIKNNKANDKSGSKLRKMLRTTLLDFKLNISHQGVMMKIDIDSHSAI